MGRQYNRREKRTKRNAYLKRKKIAAKKAGVKKGS